MVKRMLAKANRLFRAFSDPVRLRILCLLARAGELCVNDLVAILRVPQPTVSRHLAYLRRAGLVAARRAAPFRLYGLAEASGTFHEKVLECLGCCFREVPAVARDAGRAAELREAGKLCAP